MTSFTSTIIPKSLSPFKESTSNEVNFLKFHGGVAYDHEALPKIVAVHTLVHVGSDQVDVPDDDNVPLMNEDVKKNAFDKVQESSKRCGKRRWIILSKPELPFNQITNNPRSEEETNPTNPSHDQSFPKKRLFDFSDMNQGYYSRNLEFGKQKTKESDEICQKNFSISLNQDMEMSCSDAKCTSTEFKMSKGLGETENDGQSSVALECVSHLLDSVKVGVQTGNKFAKDSSSGMKISGQCDETVKVEETKMDFLVAPSNHAVLSKDPVTSCADSKNASSVKSLCGASLQMQQINVPSNNMITFCSDHKDMSSGPEMIYQSTDTTKDGKSFQKQQTSEALNNNLDSSFNPGKIHQSFSSSASSSSLVGQSYIKSKTTPKEKLALKKQFKYRIKRLNFGEPSKETPEATDLCQRSSTMDLGSNFNPEEEENSEFTTLQKDDFAKPMKAPLTTQTQQSDTSPATCASSVEQKTSSTKKLKLPLKEIIRNRKKMLKLMESSKETPDATDRYQRLSTRDLGSHLDLEQEKNPQVDADFADPMKARLPTQTQQSAVINSATCASSVEKTTSFTKKGKLALKAKLMNRKNLSKLMESYKGTPEAMDLYQKLSKLTKLGFGVASSLSVLSKKGEIGQSQEFNGEGSKAGPSEDLVKEMVLMEKLRKDRKSLKSEFSAEQKNLHLKLNEVIKSKRRKNESEKIKNEICGPRAKVLKECSSSSDSTVVLAKDGDSSEHSTNSSSPETSVVLTDRNLEPCSEIHSEYLAGNMSETKRNSADAEKVSLKEKHKDGNWNELNPSDTTEILKSVSLFLDSPSEETRNDVEEAEAPEMRQKDENRKHIRIKTPEKGKSLIQCLDKLRADTSSRKRTLEMDKENGLQVTNPDSLPKRPRKSAPRRLGMGCFHDNDDNIESTSPDNSFTNDNTAGINLASSNDCEPLCASSSPASQRKGKRIEETNKSLEDEETPSEKNDLSSEERTPNEEKVSYSVTQSALRDMGNPNMLSTTLPEVPIMSDETPILDADSSSPLPPACLFAEDTCDSQMEVSAFESSCLGSGFKTVVRNHPWANTPYTTIPQENYTIKTSLDREERIKSLLAKQNQLLSKINSSNSRVKENSIG